MMNIHAIFTCRSCVGSSKVLTHCCIGHPPFFSVFNFSIYLFAVYMLIFLCREDSFKLFKYLLSFLSIGLLSMPNSNSYLCWNPNYIRPCAYSRRTCSLVMGRDVMYILVHERETCLLTQASTASDGASRYICIIYVCVFTRLLLELM